MTLEGRKGEAPLVYEINGVFMSDFAMQKDDSVWLGNDMALKFEKKARINYKGKKKTKHSLAIVSPGHTPITEEFNGEIRHMGSFRTDAGVMVTSVDFNSSKYKEGRQITVGDYILDLSETYSVDGYEMSVKVSTLIPGLQIRKDEEEFSVNELLERMAAMNTEP